SHQFWLTHPMKASSALPAALLLLAFAPKAFSQSQPPAKIDPAADDPISLSAFHVSSSADVGYTATSTLAGTRLNTPLRDVGTAVSVVTKEFLNDVNANDSSTLLTYTVSTEIGGMEGNYAGGNFGVSR